MILLGPHYSHRSSKSPAYGFNMEFFYDCPEFPPASDLRTIRRNSVQIIDGSGNFNFQDLENFAGQTRFETRGAYSVIAIMGPQSTGKSTLLNHLFDTNFKRMDSSKGRSQTTKGIWLAAAPQVYTQEFTLVMDVEGTDGRERGQDNDTFEKQTSLFALVISDLLMINMWTNSIGLEHAASKPLLRIVFEIMMNLFSDEFKRKKTLMFVLRDHDEEETPLKQLDKTVRQDIQKIWDEIRKTETQNRIRLDNLFNVEVVALPHLRYRPEEFKEQVASLRQQLPGFIAAGGPGINNLRPTASEFLSIAAKFWTQIKENKDLNLLSHKFIMATVRCEKIVDMMYNSFINNQEWRQLEATVKFKAVPEFGKTITSMISDYLSRYDKEAKYYDKEVRTSKRELLKQRLLQVVQQSHHRMLRHISLRILDGFGRAYDQALNTWNIFDRIFVKKERYMKQFDSEVRADATIGQAEWDCSEVREELGRSIDKHISAANMQSSLVDAYMRELDQALSGPVSELLERAGPDTWQNIRNLFKSEEQRVSKTAFTDLKNVEMDEERKNKTLQRLKAHARSIVETKANKASRRALDHLRNRFNEKFNIDPKTNKAREWGLFDSVEKHTGPAHNECLQVLCVLAAIRLDDDYDVIRSTLFDALGSRGGRNDSQLASDSWDEADAGRRRLAASIIPASDELAILRTPVVEFVPRSDILLTPKECKEVWTKFESNRSGVIEAAKKIISGKRTIAALCTVAGLAAGGVVSTAVWWTTTATAGMESAVAMAGFGSTFLGSSTAAIAKWFRPRTHNSSPSPVKEEDVGPANSEARSATLRMLVETILIQALMDWWFPESSTQLRNQGHTIPGGVSKSRRVVRRTSRDIHVRTVQTEEIEECYDITISSREMLFDPLLQNNAGRRLPPTLNAPSPRPALTL